MKDSDLDYSRSKAGEKLNFSTKLAYGAGDLGPAITANVSVFFLLVFFTNVAGIPAGMAGSILMIGKENSDRHNNSNKGLVLCMCHFEPWRVDRSSETNYGSWPTHDHRIAMQMQGDGRLVSETLGSDGHRLRHVFPFLCPSLSDLS